MATIIMMKKPVHPGQFVRLMVLEPLGLNVKQAATVLNVSRATLSNLVNQKASLSPEMAIRLDKVFGADMETLMRMQNAYDIAQARKQIASIELKPFQATPVADQSGLQ